MSKRLFLIVISLIFCIPMVTQAKTITLPLKDILQVDNIRLIGTSSNTDRYDFKLPVPKRWHVTQARISMDYTNSSALIKSRSKLTFLFEGIPLSQVSLDPKSTNKTLNVSIPGRLLTTGYHSFGFEVSQHSVEDACEDPFAPELWTSLLLRDAIIEFNYELLPVPLRLSASNDFLFDPKNPSAPNVELVYTDLSPNTMKAVSLCASGISIRYEYRGIQFSANSEIQFNTDTLVIGSPEDIKKIFAPYPMPESIVSVQGPQISIHHLPDTSIEISSADYPKIDSTHAVIIITGRTEEEILMAAKAFSLITLPLPDSQSTLIEGIQLPELSPHIKKNGLLPGYMYSFKSLGFFSETFKGINSVPKGFSFWIPSDSNLVPNDQAVLSLNIAYGAAMRDDSVLNVILNDKFVAAIPCNDMDGGTYQNYKIRLRMSSMKHGYNKIIFSPQMTPFHTDQCTLVQTGNLRLTLFDNSSFTIPELDYWIEMPNLSAFITDGFPFGKYPDMRDTQVLIPDKSRSSFLAAVNLIALTAQKTGYPPLNVEWQLNSQIIEDKNVIVVSKSDNIPVSILKAAPLKLAGKSSMENPHLTRPKGIKASDSDGFLPKRASSRQFRLSRVFIKDSNLVMVKLSPNFTKGRAAVMEFQSPFNRNRTILTVTAHTDADMRLIPKAIWKTEFQTALSGDTTLINLLSKNIETYSIKLGSSYYLGEISSLPLVDYYANTYPIWFIGLVLLLCILTGFLIYRILKKRKLRRFADD